MNVKNIISSTLVLFFVSFSTNHAFGVPSVIQPENPAVEPAITSPIMPENSGAYDPTAQVERLGEENEGRGPASSGKSQSANIGPYKVFIKK